MQRDAWVCSGMQRVAGGCSGANLAAAKPDWVKIKYKIHSRKSNLGAEKIKWCLPKVRPQSQETQMGNKSRPAGIVTGLGGEPEI